MNADQYFASLTHNKARKLERRIRMMKAYVDAADAIDFNTLGIVAHQCYDEVCQQLYATLRCEWLNAQG